MEYTGKLARAGMLVGAAIIATALYPTTADAQQKRPTTVVVYKAQNGSVNVGVNGRYTNVTSYASGIRAEQRVRQLQRENLLRNRKPVISIRIRR
jgi:hypothetical protein